MKTQLLLSSILLAISGAVASPVALVDKRATDPSETDILQYALTLENLENAFYRGALQKYDANAFKNAGLPDFVRGRISQIAMHENTHVNFLKTALGSGADAECKYSFPYTDPKSFLALASVLEGVGTSAYLGGAQYLGAAIVDGGSILATEARHNAWITSVSLHGMPWSGSFETPLTQRLVMTLASQFIVPGSCPSSNAPSPFQIFPSLGLFGNQSPAPGDTIQLKYKEVPAPPNGTKRYLALLHGLTTQFVEITRGKNGPVAILPKGLQGIVYGVVTSSNTQLTDDNTIAGPNIFNFPFTSDAANP